MQAAYLLAVKVHEARGQRTPQPQGTKDLKVCERRELHAANRALVRFGLFEHLTTKRARDDSHGQRVLRCLVCRRIFWHE